MTRPDLETIFETKMVSNRSRDHFETKMSHYLEWRDWFRDHIRDQNGLNSGLETSIDTKMSHSESNQSNQFNQSNQYNQSNQSDLVSEKIFGLELKCTKRQLIIPVFCKKNCFDIFDN